jgi:hypothetical protein
VTRSPSVISPTSTGSSPPPAIAFVPAENVCIIGCGYSATRSSSAPARWLMIRSSIRHAVPPMRAVFDRAATPPEYRVFDDLARPLRMRPIVSPGEIRRFGHHRPARRRTRRQVQLMRVLRGAPPSHLREGGASRCRRFWREPPIGCTWPSLAHHWRRRPAIRLPARPPSASVSPAVRVFMGDVLLTAISSATRALTTRRESRRSGESFERVFRRQEQPPRVL